MKRQWIRWRIVWLAAVTSAATVGMAGAVAEDADGTAPADASVTKTQESAPRVPETEFEKPRLKPIVPNQDWGMLRAKPSRETTWVTQPLRENGTVDYLAAYNRMRSRGVSRENNAAIPLLEVLGPGAARPFLGLSRAGQEAVATKAKGQMGLRWDEDAGFFVNWIEFTHAHRPRPKGDEWDQIEMAYTAPWSAQEYPLVAGWLLVNDRHLDRIAEAAVRDRYYTPVFELTESPEYLINDVWGISGHFRWMARGLCARAMQRLHAGSIERGWDDVVATYRLGRLLAQSGALLDCLIGLSVEGMANDAALAFARDGRTPGPVLLKMERDIATLAPMRQIADVVLNEERLIGLQMIQVWSVDGTVSDLALPPFDGSDIFEDILSQKPRSVARSCRLPLVFDAAELMRHHNEGMESTARLLQTRPYSVVRPQLERMQEEANDAGKAAYRRFSDAQWLARYVTSTPEQRRAMMTPVVRDLLGNDELGTWVTVGDLDAITETRTNLTRIAFALVAYEEKEGKYPDTLAALSPDYMRIVPADLMDGKPLRYERTETGCVVYSVGVDFADDRGDDEKDIAVTLGQWPAPAAGGDE